MDRLDCYELCVQSPRHVTLLLRALHAGDPDAARGEPVALREDFCGTAAVSRRWLSEARARGIAATAVALDLDPDVLAHAARKAQADGVAPDLRLVHADAVHAPVTPGDACDIVFVGNFSIGYIHERADLVAYLRRSHHRLALGNGGFGGGVFVCDVYDGPHKFDLGVTNRTHPSRGHELVHYTWQHRAADPLSAMVENAIHFRVESDGEIVREMFDAFVYRWRLWSISELRDALREAGFSYVGIYAEASSGPRPLESPDDFPASGVVCIAARA